VLVSKGVVQPIVQKGVTSTDPDVLANCAEVIRNFARHEGSRPTIISHRAIELLLKLLQSPEAPVQIRELSTGALANLALCSDSVPLMVQVKRSDS
jgi:hypothetical protein